MDELDKYIDNLFEQKLSGASMPGASSGAEWAKIGKALQKKSFLKFSLVKFNIYYLSSIFFASAITGFIFLPTISKPDKNDPIPVESSNILVDSVEFIDCVNLDKDTLVINSDTIKEAIDKRKNNTAVIKTEICKTKTEKIVDKKESAIQERICSDIELKSLAKEINDSASCDQHQHKILPIIAADTIYVSDTIRIQKKRKMLRREK